MKFNFLNLILGIILGSVSFFGVEFLGESAITPGYVHLVFIPLFALVAFLPHFKKRFRTETRKGTFLFISFIFFTVGFFVQFLLWAFVVIQALSNAIG